MMDHNFFMKNRSGRRTALFLLVLFFLTANPLPGDAYFNRGTVSVSLGQSAVSMTAGSTAEVSVAVDPIKQDQLPGCGMAECPQTCGDGCLNESGECTCAGTEYKTYYAEISVSSSNSQTATASYSNGTLTVKGHSPGSAQITVTGKLRQYTDSSVILNVTVTENNSGGSSYGGGGSSGSGAADYGRGDSAPSWSSSSSSPSGSQQESPSSAGSTSQGGVSVEDAGSGSISADSPAGSSSQETGSAAQGSASDRKQEQTNSEGNGEAAQQQTEEDGHPLTGEYAPEGELRDTARGKYRFVVMTASTDVPACFIDSANEGSHLVFQKKTGDNVDYSWTFDGNSLNPEDDYSGMDLVIGSSPECPELIKDDLNGAGAYYMDFEYSGKLPAAAEIYMNVRESFPEDQDLCLYQVNDLNGKLKELDDSVEMSNGYASFTLHHCSSYLLTDSPLKGVEQAGDDGGLLSSDDGLGLPLTLFILFSAVAAIVLIFFFFRRPKRR